MSFHPMDMKRAEEAGPQRRGEGRGEWGLGRPRAGPGEVPALMAEPQDSVEAPKPAETGPLAGRIMRLRGELTQISAEAGKYGSPSRREKG